jgi:hypothetical protein
LKTFYRTFVSKKGVQSGDKKKIEEVIGSDLEKQLKKFTFQIRYDDLKVRMNLYSTAPLILAVILCFCYASKFIKLFTSHHDAARWLNSITMILGTLIHSKNSLIDIYGYLVVATIFILEIILARNLKTTIKESMIQFYKTRTTNIGKDISSIHNQEAIKQLLIEDSQSLRDQSKSNVGKFLIKIKTSVVGDDDATELAKAQLAHFKTSNLHNNKRGSLSSNYEDQIFKSNFNKIENFSPFTYDPDFLGGQEFDLNPAIQKNLDEEEEKNRIQVLHFDSQRPPEDLEQDPATSLLLRDESITLGYKIGKLLYYFENRDLYLNCKMFYGLVYLMFRMAFFVLISIGDTINCVLSFISLAFLCYYWYKSTEVPLQSFNSLNKLAILIISAKYLIGMLDIQRKNFSGDDIDFQSSIVLMFVSNTDNKNYYLFNRLVDNSLQDYWLLLECLIFVAFQLLIFFYTIILQLNTTVINRHTTKILYMTLKYIHYNLSIMTKRPFYINFERWFSPKIKYAEMFLKMGTIYLPIIAVIGLLAFAQANATLPIFAIIVLSLFVIYQLIFNWMYSILEQKTQIGKYFSKIRILIWIYILLGSASRIFEKPLHEFYSGFSPLTSLTLIMVTSLLCFQGIIDLWDSRDFERFYSEFLSTNKLSQIVIPLCEAYEFNEAKLLSMINNLKSKENLDRRIRVMEKQLKIWHLKFATSEELKNSGGRAIGKELEAWEKEIADLDKEEENLVLELRNEEYLTSQVGILDQIVNYCYISLLGSLNRFNMCPHLYLMDYIKSKNSEICKDIELKIYDYISQEYEEYTSLAQGIYEFYNSKNEVADKLADLKKIETQKSNKIQNLDSIENKPETSLEKAVDIIWNKILRPKETVAINMTQHQSTKDRKLFFDSDVNGMKIRFYNVMETGKQDISIIHRMSNYQKISHLLKLTPYFIMDNFQGITLGTILVYCMYNPSILKLVLLIHVILNGLTEELNVHRNFWKRAFILIAGISSIKLLFKSIFRSKLISNQTSTFTAIEGHNTYFMIIEFFCGSLDIEALEVAAFLLTVLRIMQAQLEGCFLSYTMQFENISEAYMRVVGIYIAQNQPKV